jgi:prophage antirepressor-like protein
MRSKLPAAEKFEDWVVDVVLPTIRKTGGYVASDIAKIWGYSDTINAIKRHCRGVAKRHLPHPQSPEKTINVSIIPERDVYRLIMRSKLLAAEKFEDWITLVITNNQD